MIFKAEGSILHEDAFVLSSDELDVYKIGVQVVEEYLNQKKGERHL